MWGTESRFCSSSSISLIVVAAKLIDLWVPLTGATDGRGSTGRMIFGFFLEPPSTEILDKFLFFLGSKNLMPSPAPQQASTSLSIDDGIPKQQQRRRNMNKRRGVKKKEDKT